MHKLVLGSIVALVFYEFIALLTRVNARRKPNLFSEARIMRLRKIVSEEGSNADSSHG